MRSPEEEDDLTLLRYLDEDVDPIELMLCTCPYCGSTHTECIVGTEYHCLMCYEDFNNMERGSEKYLHDP